MDGLAHGSLYKTYGQCQQAVLYQSCYRVHLQCFASACHGCPVQSDRPALYCMHAWPNQISRLILQVSSTPEEAVLKDATPQQYAERNFQSCLKFPWTTLGPAEMKQVAEHEASIRAEYLKRATKIGEGLVRGNDVVSTYTMQWADAVNLS